MIPDNSLAGALFLAVLIIPVGLASLLNHRNVVAIAVLMTLVAWTGFLDWAGLLAAEFSSREIS